ncbi:MAG TPA: methyltransferase [Candidatus Sulfomarinibacteraceae bacterium]|nr:methyltransferase [Candidatus Sulfomarinibacteraceae bacterium]
MADRKRIAELIALGLIRLSEDRYEPLIRIDRVEDVLVASDLRRRRRAPDYVVGPGPASFLLARHVRPPGRGRVLDLGSGSGIQALLLARHGVDILGLDVNPRALAMARFNAGINGRRIAFEHGDFLAAEPDRTLDGRFETVVANPPFVLAPSARLVYRDRPLPGDQVSRRTIERVARVLAEGGRGYVLCNWIDRGGRWSDPVRAWVDPGFDAVVVLLGTHAPADYAAIWNRDLPPADKPGVIADWIRALAAEGIGRIHVGLVALGRPPVQMGRRRRFEAVDRADRAIDGETIEGFLAG